MITKKDFFKRQTTLIEIGEAKQQQLQNAKVVIIGCGGLGSPIAIYLASAGIGTIHLIDFDVVSVSNLHRQVFYNLSYIGKSKSEILAAEIQKKTPFTTVSFSTEAISKKNVLNAINDYDVVIDGTDSLPIKYLINDACVLKNKPLVYGSLYKFDGYVSTFNVKNQLGEVSCNLRDAFPKIDTNVPNCEQAGTLNSIVGIIALLQANEVLKLITQTGKLLTNQLLIYNSLDNTQLKIKLKKNNELNIEEIFKNSDYFEVGCEFQESALLISSEELKNSLSNRKIEIIGVFNSKKESLPFSISRNMPFSNFDYSQFFPDFEKEYVIVCDKGVTSYQVTQKLRELFPKLTVRSLSGGVEEF